MGALSPLHGVGPDDLKIRDLLARGGLYERLYRAFDAPVVPLPPAGAELAKPRRRKDAGGGCGEGIAIDA